MIHEAKAREFLLKNVLGQSVNDRMERALVALLEEVTAERDALLSRYDDATCAVIAELRRLDDEKSAAAGHDLALCNRDHRALKRVPFGASTG